MALRFARQVWADWKSAVRDIVDTLSSIQRDEDEPTRWDDIPCPAQSIVLAGLTSPPTYDSAEGALSFAAASVQVVQGIAQLPHTWAEGTTVVPHLHVYPASTASGSSNAVQWRLRYKHFGMNSAVPAWTELSLTHSLTAGLRIAQTVELARISGTGKRLDSIFAWEVARVGSALADTYTGPVLVVSVDLHVKKSRNRGSPRIGQTGYE